MRNTLEKNCSGSKKSGMWKSSAKPGNCLLRSAGSCRREEKAPVVRTFFLYLLKCIKKIDHQAPFFVRLKVLFVPFGRPPPATEGSSSHPETKPISFSLKEYVCVFYYVLSDPHLTQEEVRVFLLWCSFHKFIKWQSPVNVEHMTSLEVYHSLHLCVYIYHCEDILALCSFKELCDTQSWFNKMLYS